MDAPERARRRFALWLDRVTSYAERRTLSQTQIAATLNVSQPTISRWATGEVSMPFHLLDDIAGLMGTTASALVAPPAGPAHPIALDTPELPAADLPAFDFPTGAAVPDAKRRLLHLIASLEAEECARLIAPIRRMILLPAHRDFPDPATTEGD